MGVQRAKLSINLITKVNKRSDGSDVGWKAFPQMCPTVSSGNYV